MPLSDAELAALPVARIEKKAFFSFIWFIPLIAALIGAWLVYKVNSEKGELVTVIFAEAEGIQAKKTPVRYKDVEVGRVESVNLDPELKHVQVKVQLDKHISEHLGPDSQFWVYRPRISMNEISGLTTLLSGIYISMDPGDKAGDVLPAYQALSKPPRITTDSDGQIVTLHADRLGSLDTGSPIYYRQIRVGEVIKYELDADKDKVAITTFINAPYHKLVRANSRFWNISGLDLSITSDGLSARMESFASLIIGGITFETPRNLQVSLPVNDDKVFQLYDSEKAANEKIKGQRLYYIMHFKGSLRGLNVGAAVEYRGIPVGKVEDIQLLVSPDNENLNIPVLVSVYVDLFSAFGEEKDAEKTLESLVEKGMKAELKTANLLTGSQIIALTMPDKADFEAGKIIKPTESSISYAEFPTKSGFTQQLTRSAANIVEQVQLGVKDIRRLINSPGIADSTEEVSRILKETRLLVADLKPELTRSMRLVTKTLDETQQLVANASPEVVSTIKMVKGTVGNVNDLVRQAKPGLVSSINRTDAVLANTNDLIHQVKPEVLDSMRGIRHVIGQSQGLMNGLKGDVMEVAHYLKGTLRNAESLTGQINQEFMPLSNQTKKTMLALERTLIGAQKTLHNANAMLGENSAVQYEMRQLIEEVTQAANAFSILADTLQRQPNSVIFGK